MTNRNHRSALIPGNGIATEVVPPARRFPKVPVPFCYGPACFLPFDGAYRKAKEHGRRGRDPVKPRCDVTKRDLG
ncbi:hypothetical protein [Streptomyces sp. NBC_00078]|uniref:hypothetical protein n=1 Tax=unclassified Streptomyces TaxID=2593676 RepID=UPI0022592468|nr:hypothetical protein [Streptomyces sp. NBC_00078]MCX5418207.1 hypothetical protein [Streptomyces sp. NBC_00078]